jgi:nitrile hydratase subunit beta
MSYRPGDRVRVSGRPHEGHHRTPGYLKGKLGTVEHGYGSFPNPEQLAYGQSGLPARALYRVSFEQSELWPDYRDGPRDRLCADLYEHWLERT